MGAFVPLRKKGAERPSSPSPPALGWAWSAPGGPTWLGSGPRPPALPAPPKTEPRGRFGACGWPRKWPIRGRSVGGGGRWRRRRRRRLCVCVCVGHVARQAWEPRWAGIGETSGMLQPSPFSGLGASEHPTCMHIAPGCCLAPSVCSRRAFYGSLRGASCQEQVCLGGEPKSEWELKAIFRGERD